MNRTYQYMDANVHGTQRPVVMPSLVRGSYYYAHESLLVKNSLLSVTGPCPICHLCFYRMATQYAGMSIFTVTVPCP